MKLSTLYKSGQKQNNHVHIPTIPTLTKIMPWMFALDHIHYSRWLQVHIRDIMALASKHPKVAKEFHSGKFVVNKTGNKSSAMAID